MMRCAFGRGSAVWILGRADFAVAGRRIVSVGIGFCSRGKHDYSCSFKSWGGGGSLKGSLEERGGKLVASKQIGPNVRREHSQVATWAGRVIQPARRSAVSREYYK